MKRMEIGWMGLLGLLSGMASAAPQETSRPATPFVAHEWGTLLTMNGSDGVVLDSMYHEEHALPDFVHALSQDQLYPPEALLKFETPVIYFYTDQPRHVEVTAKFPTGIWTHWFPQADTVRSFMAKPDAPITGKEGIRRGSIHWQAELLPARTHLDSLLPRTTEGSLWNFARQVDAAYVQTAHKQAGATGAAADGLKETERYLFYRGLGNANLPLAINAQNGGTLSLPDNANVCLAHLFVMRVENGRGTFRYIPALKAGETLTRALPDMSKAEPISQFAAHIGNELAAKLEASGLYAKEARAMVNTWNRSYFQSEGVRVLYVLPQTWTEAFIPLQITPRPDNLVRVMVGRTELLTPEREQQVAQAVRMWAGTDANRRETALNTLHNQGRYLQPILRRLARTTEDRTVREGCRKLLLTAWVNELRPTPFTTAQK